MMKTDMKEEVLLKYFMDKGKSPCSTYKFITEDTWGEFCGLKSTIEFKKKKGKALVKLNKNPHRLGLGGYRRKKAKWTNDRMEGKLPDVQCISSERTRHWVMARLGKAGLENYVIPENIQEITNQIKRKETQATQRSRVLEG